MMRAKCGGIAPHWLMSLQVQCSTPAQARNRCYMLHVKVDMLISPATRGHPGQRIQWFLSLAQFSMPCWCTAIVPIVNVNGAMFQGSENSPDISVPVGSPVTHCIHTLLNTPVVPTCCRYCCCGAASTTQPSLASAEHTPDIC